MHARTKPCAKSTLFSLFILLLVRSTPFLALRVLNDRWRRVISQMQLLRSGYGNVFPRLGIFVRIWRRDLLP